MKCRISIQKKRCQSAIGFLVLAWAAASSNAQGWKDLLIAQGHDLDTIKKSFPQLRYKEPMMLLRNTGQRFVDVSGISSEIFREAWVGRGMAIGDLDNYGRIDAVVTMNGGTAHVLRNVTETANHRITLRLIGHKSNRDGIGARVKIVTAQGSQWATVTTWSGYLSASDPRCISDWA